MKYSSIPVDHRESLARSIVMELVPGKEGQFEPKEGSDCIVAIPRRNGTISRGKLKYAAIQNDGLYLFDVYFEEGGEPKTKTISEAAFREVNPDVQILFGTLETQSPSVMGHLAAARGFIARLLGYN